MSSTRSEIEQEDLYMGDLIELIRSNATNSIRLDIDMSKPFEMQRIESALCRNTCIEHIDLSNKQVGVYVMDTLVQKIFQLPRLKSLDLSNNEIDARALHTLSLYVAHSQTIEEIDLTGNTFASEEIDPFFIFFQMNSTLKKIHWDEGLLNEKQSQSWNGLMSRNARMFTMDAPLEEEQSSGTSTTSQVLTPPSRYVRTLGFHPATI
jgi:hypothetical protein